MFDGSIPILLCSWLPLLVKQETHTTPRTKTTAPQVSAGFTMSVHYWSHKQVRGSLLSVGHLPVFKRTLIYPPNLRRGRRLVKTIPTGSGSNTHSFIFNWNNTVAVCRAFHVYYIHRLLALCVLMASRLQEMRQYCLHYTYLGIPITNQKNGCIGYLLTKS